MTDFATESLAAVSSDLLTRATAVFEYTHKSATSLLSAFDDAKAKRGRPRGILTDQEQDILRAALVMCCAGMDAALKHAIRDCLEQLLEKNAQVREGFEKFIRKRIGGEGDILELGGGVKFVAAVLAEKEPRRRLIEEYIKELTGESLQSAEEVMRTTAALGLDYQDIDLDVPRLKEIFGIRNKIIHELDIDLSAKKRKQRVRSQSDLLDSSDYILQVTKVIIETLNGSL